MSEILWRDLLEDPWLLLAASLVRGSDPVPGSRDRELDRLAALFMGNPRCHARQWVRDGRVGYSPVHHPLDLPVLQEHLAGQSTVGVYPMIDATSCRWLCFDVDAPARSDHALPPLALETGLELRQRLADAGAPAMLTDSGRRGCHLWVFFREPVPAARARAFARRVLVELRPPDGVTIEVFPKQDALTEPSKLGNLVKLPFGIHRLSGRRCSALGDDGAVRPGWREAVAAVELTPPELLDEPVGDVPVGAIEEEYDVEADDELQSVLEGCRPLAEITARAARGAVSYDERVVLVHSLGHLLHGPQAIRAILPGSSDLPELRIRSRLRGHPISCRGLRRRLPIWQGAPACACEFDDAARYPSPCLHGVASGRPASARPGDDGPR